jgi:lysozyme family protein
VEAGAATSVKVGDQSCVVQLLVAVSKVNPTHSSAPAPAPHRDAQSAGVFEWPDEMVAPATCVAACGASNPGTSCVYDAGAPTEHAAAAHASSAIAMLGCLGLLFGECPGPRFFEALMFGM